ncbi:hypothetical protein G8A07_26830 [Roseateles sp. DAIF2]|uniref:hypothetical protein n=1 Tax=Roseateles sp. DAIF2 TaxID=2714952 RepID=UPI0018A265D9|nr:hypothetical protein [Roseateles sp. DAIF2]QPF76184.1 hypothetical protein G8A07_26830 [Roseateles sp. DAIF2]
MSKPIEAILAECEDLISRNEVSRAFDTLLALIQHGSKADIQRLQPSLGEIIGRFLPKRKRDLGQALEQRLGTSDTRDAVPIATRKCAQGGIKEFEATVSERFDELSRWHIFQWSTYYRDELRGILADVVDLIRADKAADAAFDLLRDHARKHAREIFTKGYNFVMSQPWAVADSAEGKALGGLRSFLVLPVELYADQSARLSAPQDCRVLRRATSRLLSAILLGFTEATLGSSSSIDMLRRTVKSWAHVLPLLEGQDLKAVDQRLGLDSLSPILGEPLHRLTRALDEASQMSSVDPIVVLFTSMNLDDRVLDVTLRPPADSSDTKPLEVAVIGGDGIAARSQIEQRAKHGYIACLTNKPARDYWGGKFVPGTISELVVPFAEADSGFLLTRLRQRFHETKVVIPRGAPLRTNVAERFPLENPTLLTFFRVQRQSIRALEATISNRTGVLLWCSVRRSGKTTGVSELANAIQEKSAVFQRCEMTGLDMGSRVLFEAVRDALSELTPLPKDFVRKLVAQAAPMGVAPSQGSILILDEYDRLFGLLRAAGRRNEDARHLVVQPLLDQFVEFATENLLIFLGQQPNAHFIFMDQNQLSAYVQQESYPLFSHSKDATQGEFWGLLEKVFSNTLKYDASFANVAFEETGGHPFLTVNLLRELVDWLISKSVVPSDVMLTKAVFDEFMSERLDPKSIALSKHFEYFRSAAAEALSEDGAQETPWVHTAYHLLTLLGTSGSGGKLAADRADIEASLTTTLERTGLSSFTCESFIASAARSNFVEVEDDQVAAKIPILARIASATRR